MISRSITSILALAVLSFVVGNEMNIYRYNRLVFALHRRDGPMRAAQRRRLCLRQRAPCTVPPDPFGKFVAFP